MGLNRVPDLDSLLLLLEVASSGSLGRAGVHHGISQPAVSARIRAMEQLVGFPVLERTARGSTLTPNGVLLAGWAQRVLDEAETLGAGVASLRSDVEHRLRVAASMTVAEHLLPSWLVRLAAHRPDTTVSLLAMNSAAVQAAVLADRAELGFIEGPELSSQLDARVVATDRLVVVAPPAHPWTRRRRRLDGAELAATRLVQREPTSGTRTSMEAALAAYGPTATPLLELSTSGAVCSAVAAGAGPAVLSNLAVRDDLATGRLVEIPVTGLTLNRALRVVWKHGQRPGGPARELIEIAVHRVG